jgi:S-adenosylmethionine hydrolase
VKAGPIVLLTDFGLQDAYVGLMKGVIAGIAPQAVVLDLTHGIPQGDVHRSAYHLWQSIPFFPKHSVFVAVVDPGVGTGRRALGASWPDFTCIAPDNGLLTYICERSEPAEVVELTSPRFWLSQVSATFHGRDVFAPAAAHIALGASLGEMGPPATDLVKVALPSLTFKADSTIRGQVLFSDQFGNLITSVGLLHTDGEDLVLDPWLSGCPTARLKIAETYAELPDGTQLAISDTFEDVERGKPVAYIGSSSLLEIGVNRGNAERMLGLSAGQEILLIRRG